MDDTIPEDPPLKQCYRCKEFFPATRQFFFANKKAKDGLLTRCKFCSEHRSHPRYQAKEGYKRCSQCKVEYPCTTDYFHSDSSQPDHFGYRCKQCVLATRATQYAIEKQKIQEESKPSELICKKCGISKPLTEEFFYKKPLGRYGVFGICKKCSDEQAKSYRMAHLEDVRKYHARYYQLNKDRIAAYYLVHRAELLELGRMRYWENRDRNLKHMRRYRQSERGRMVLQVGSRTRKARKKGAEGSFTSHDIQRQLKAQHGKCYWCQVKLVKYHIDHVIPLSRGGSNWPDNIVLACPPCNLSRNNKLPHEWPKGGRLL